jgi:hypothetical protein
MSHYTVAVIHTKDQNIDDLLAPFDENIDVPEYKDEVLTERDMLSFIDYAKDVTDELPSDMDTVFEQFEYYYAKEEIANDWNSNMYKKDEDGNWAEYSTYNPKSKWDWYERGGRWAGMLQVKEGVDYNPPGFSWGWSEEDKAEVLKSRKCDSSRIGDLDMEAMLKSSQEYHKGIWMKVAAACGIGNDGCIQEPEVDYDAIRATCGAYNKEHHKYWAEHAHSWTAEEREEAREAHRLKREEIWKEWNEDPVVKAFDELTGFWLDNVRDYLGMTCEEYVSKKAQAFSTYAILKDGEWLEAGKMGWWGISDATDEEKQKFQNDYMAMIESLDKDLWITIVDCHI